MDAHDLCRLFIGYEKICSKDGTAFNEVGICKHAHVREAGLPLEMEVREKARYKIIRLEDISHAVAKRYSAKIILDRHYPKEVVKTIIQEVTEKLKCTNYYRSELVKERWGKTPA